MKVRLPMCDFNRFAWCIIKLQGKPNISFLYKKENNERIGDGLGRAPAKPLSPGGDDKPRPVASFKKLQLLLGFRV